jgi:hypothetical protein
MVQHGTWFSGQRHFPRKSLGRRFFSEDVSGLFDEHLFFVAKFGTPVAVNKQTNLRTD